MQVDQLSSQLYRLRPNSARYHRIDEVLLSGDLKHILDNHAIHETLKGYGKIEIYEIYKSIENDEIYSLIKFGDKLNGHPNILHGGIIALMFDNTFGWLFYSLNIPKSVTANLNINFRAPTLSGSFVILKAKMKSIEGRKLFMTATLENECGEILADSSTLFITLKSEVK